MSDDTATIIVRERIRSKADLLARGRRAATGFAELGVHENDAVALLLRNDFAFLEATHAANAIGAYAVPLNWHASPDEITYMLDDSKPKVLVVHADLPDVDSADLVLDAAKCGSLRGRGADRLERIEASFLQQLKLPDKAEAEDLVDETGIASGADPSAAVLAKARE